jgi:hypothetical protein
MILEAADGAEVIAEDLGTVPDYVRPSLADLGIAGMKVPQWEFTDGRVSSSLHYPALSFATYASHDHAPMRAQWEQQRQRMFESDHGGHDYWEARNFLETLCAFAGIERPDGEIPEYSPEVWNKLFPRAFHVEFRPCCGPDQRTPLRHRAHQCSRGHGWDELELSRSRFIQGTDYRKRPLGVARESEKSLERNGTFAKGPWRVSRPGEERWGRRLRR